MSNQSGYKKQQTLSFVQLLSEAPAFIVTLISAIFANTMLLFVDLMDSFGNLLRAALVTILSKKLSKDLRYEYNYGIGKIEAMVSLFVIWLLRNNPLGGYISPVISIFVAVYLMIGCIKRTKIALEDLTDKTLPEEIQMKILNILVRFFNSYTQVHAINSHKSGDVVRIDLYLSFEKNTSYEEIININKQMQAEFDRQIGNCHVNIIVGED